MSDLTANELALSAARYGTMKEPIVKTKFLREVPRASLDRLGDRTLGVHRRRSRPHHARRLRSGGRRPFAAGPGLLSSFVVLQVVVYAGAQVPAGPAARPVRVQGPDRVRRRADGVGPAGAGVHRVAAAAIAARAVVGLGDAVTFISVLRLVPHWFAPDQVPLVTQLTGICGQLGQVLSAVPFLALLAGRGLDHGICVGGRARRGVDRADVARGQEHPERLGRRPRRRCRCAKYWSASKPSGCGPGTRLGFFTHMGTQFSVTVFALMWGLPYLTVGAGAVVHVAGTLLSLSVVAAILSGIVIGIFTGRKPAPTVTAGAGDHRQQCRGLDGGAGAARRRRRCGC